MKSVPQMINFAKLLHFATYATLTDMIVSFWICGQTHQKSDEIHELLDEMSANSLSDYEYNEWLKFKIIDRKTRIGFTIGGFAPMKFTSLLAVIEIFILIYFNYFFKLQIFSFMLNYTILLLFTMSNDINRTNIINNSINKTDNSITQYRGKH